MIGKYLNIPKCSLGVAMLLALVMAIFPQSLAAQEGGEEELPPLRVSLVTASEGAEIYQLEGHTALRLQREGHYDLAVNWGVFDFHSPNFVWRFVKGETDYMVAAYPFRYFLQEYEGTGRTITEQPLRLSAQEAQAVEALIQENLLPENRTYRYNYVKDNCATRPLAIIEQAIGGRICPDSAWVAGVESGGETTFRREMERYHANYPWYQFGIDLALGSGIDYPLELRERAFAPVFLQQMVEHSARANGEAIADAPTVLMQGDGAVEEPTPWPLSPLGVAVDLLVICIIFTIADFRRKKVTRWLDSLLFTLFFLGGCLITFLVFISVHEATSPNWLLLWLNPFCVIPAVGVWIKKMRNVVYFYQICNFALLILLLASVHWLGQSLNTAAMVLICCDLLRAASYILINRK